MTLSKNQFLLLLLAILVAPFVVYKIIWIANSKKTIGKVYFIGHTLELNGGISSHLVILFKDGKQTITFNAPVNPHLKVNDNVPVRYKKDNPTDARINSFTRIWGDTIVYALWPFCVLLVIFFIPERLDPIVPRHSKIIFGKKPFIQVLSKQKP
jgi:hypothetical protein